MHSNDVQHGARLHAPRLSCMPVSVVHLALQLPDACLGVRTANTIPSGQSHRGQPARRLAIAAYAAANLGIRAMLQPDDRAILEFRRHVRLFSQQAQREPRNLVITHMLRISPSNHTLI